MTHRPTNLEYSQGENSSDDAAHEAEPRPVGYKNPPVRSRFRKGEPSPNPKGRPKREESWDDLFRKELNKRILIEENGTRSRITKRRAWMKRVANGTVKRDPNSVKTFLKFERPGEAPERAFKLYILG